MPTIRVLTITAAAACVMTAAAIAAAQEVHRWVDENGVVHFGDRPPQQQPSEIVDILPAPEPQVPADELPANPEDEQPTLDYAQQKREQRSVQRREAARKQQQLATECAANRKVVATLEPRPRVLMQHPDGSVERMDDNDRLQVLRDAKDFISRNCD